MGAMLQNAHAIVSTFLIRIALGCSLFALITLNGIASAGVAKAIFSFHDDFSRYKLGSDGAPVWDTDSIGWQVVDGVYRSDSRSKSFAVLTRAPYAKALRMEATLTVHKSLVTGWKIAGIALYYDAHNYWHLALVEAPDDADKHHFAELVESLKGRWLAQSAKDTALPVVIDTNGDFRWQYEQQYKLVLELTPQAITGMVFDAQGKLCFKRSYRFDKRDAVRTGRPALDCGGFEVTFDDVHVEVMQVAPAPQPTPKTYPPYESRGCRDIRGRRTGFFHVERHDGIWWVIDPNGYGFYIIGTDHVNYNVHWCEKLGYAPYHRNVARKYGSEDAWAEATVQRLLNWGFNSLGANNSPSTRYRGLAHTEFLGMGTMFASYSDICPKVHWTGFPNVFHPKFEEFCDKLARKRCAPNRDDPWLLGYFLDNELEWFGKSHREGGLFEEAFKKPANHSAKRALVEFLRGRYKSIDEFNRVWNTRFASFDELRRTTAPPEPRMSNERVRQRAMSDQRDWVRLIAERYFAITTAAVRKYDPNHLILGCRFAGRAPFDIWDIAGRYCDIISVNIYPRIDLEREVVIGVEENLKKWYAIAKKPFMITEWSFPALDSGLPCTHGAGMRVDTQEQRAKCFEIMQMLLFRLPFMVGSDYFMWVDEPALGISSTFPENTNYGLVNERDEPYELLTTACKRLNARVCEIHAGRLPNISVRVSSTGRRIAVRNTGKSTVRVVIAMRVDGSEMRQLVEIKPDKTRRLSVPMPRTPGGHVVECIADPTKLLAEPDRTDNYDYKVVYISGAPWAREAKDANVRIPIVIFNRSNRRLKNAPITVQLCELNRKLRWAQFKRSSCTVMVNSNGRQRRASFALLPATNGDACSPMDELTIVIPHLRQHGVCTAWLYLSKQPMSSASARGSSKLAIKIDAQRRSFILDNGRLRLIKNEPDGDAIDRVELRKPDGSWLALGKLTPLIWQYVGQDMWVAPNELESIHVAVATDTLVALDLTFVRHGASQGEVRTVVDERGEYAPVEQRPRAFRTAYRIELYIDKPWFISRFLWLENTDEERWLLRAYFHYMLSAIGGEVANDDLGTPAVPNYYMPTPFWFDAKVNASYGVIAPAEITTNLWKDKAGNQHPDVYRRVDMMLNPRERFAEPQPKVYIYGALGNMRSKNWQEVTTTLRANLKLQVTAFTAEWRRR